MGTSSFAALAGMGMMALLIMIVGGILLGALVLCLAFRFIVGYMPSYLRALSQDGSQIGFGKACLVQLIYMVIGFVLALIIGLILAAVFGMAMFGMH